MKLVKNLKIVRQNIRRTPYQALIALIVMFMTFLTLCIFLLVAAGSQLVLHHYEQIPQAIAFFKDDASTSDVKAIEDALYQTGKVTSIQYVSKDEALKIFRQQTKDNPGEQELVTANILPASINISTDNLDDLGPIADTLKKEPAVSDVIYPDDVVKKLGNFTNAVRWIGGLTTGFLIIFAGLIIIMVTGFKIRIRRTEVETMKLLGASSWFIRLPFLLEGIIYGFLGALIAWVVSYGILWYSTPLISRTFSDVNLLPVSFLVMLGLLGIELVVALLIGGLGAFWALRRYLKLD